MYPWRVHASLLITAADGSNWIGTGWFVSPRVLVTAGHCVFIKGSGVPNINEHLERIGRDATEDQKLELLAEVKAASIDKRDLLDPEEFEEIARRVLGS